MTSRFVDIRIYVKSWALSFNLQLGDGRGCGVTVQILIAFFDMFQCGRFPSLEVEWSAVIRGQLLIRHAYRQGQLLMFFC